MLHMKRTRIPHRSKPKQNKKSKSQNMYSNTILVSITNKPYKTKSHPMNKSETKKLTKSVWKTNKATKCLIFFQTSRCRSKLELGTQPMWFGPYRSASAHLLGAPMDS